MLEKCPMCGFGDHAPCAACPGISPRQAATRLNMQEEEIQHLRSLLEKANAEVDKLNDINKKSQTALIAAVNLCEKFLDQRNEALEEVERIRNHMNGIDDE